MAVPPCPLCSVRKAKRACPALARNICPVCCATKREVEIRCPADCAYLSSARTHPAAVIQRRHERDLRFMLPLIADLNREQYQLLIYLQAIVTQYAKEALPPLRDEDVAAGATALASTLETAGKGIIYQHQAASIPAQRIADELTAAIERLASQSGSHRARIERAGAVALRQIAAGAASAAKSLPDDEPPVYIRLLGRMLARAAETPADGRDEPAAPNRAGSLIIPG